METDNRVVQDTNAVEAEKHEAVSVNAVDPNEPDAADIDGDNTLEPVADVSTAEAEEDCDRDEPEAEKPAAAYQTVFTGPLPRHSLFAVLMPANPPEPKNARVIRLFDYEAAKNDPRPTVAEPPPPQPKPEPKNRDREAAKAARNQSLLAAAGFLDKLQ